MKSAMILLIAIALSGCNALLSPQLNSAYAGKDAGQAVIGISAAAGTEYSFYRFYYKRSAFNAGDQVEQGNFTFDQSTLPFSKPEYRNEQEEGAVLTARLAPGEYELFSVLTQQGTGGAVIHYTPNAPFSIRFTILPGATTYLGHFQAYATEGQNPAGATKVGPPIFLIEDRQEQDLAQARKRNSDIPGKVENATPNPTLLQRDYFVDKVPQEILDKQRGRVSMQEFLWGG